MISRTNKILQIIRDVIVLLISSFMLVVVYSNNIKNANGTEPADFILFGIAGLIGFLSLINLLLVIAGVKSRFFFYFNTILLLILSLLLTGIWANGIGIVGLIFLTLNIIILITLKRGKKT